jgi:RNA polymerase sigma-70 factor (ECF subfamily)
MSTCKDVYRHICANLDADLTSARCRRLKQHLESCPNCRAYLDSVKKTVTLFRMAPSPPLPASVHRKLFSRLATVAPPPRRIRRTHRGKSGST